MVRDREGGRGGGWVTGRGGEPGSGKGTLLREACVRQGGGTVLYVGGEESLQQIALRARRLGIDPSGIMVYAATDIADIIALAEKENGPRRGLSTFVVEAADAAVWADEPIWQDGEVVGFVTSGGYAHYVGKSVALGFAPVATIEEGARFEIEILGDLRPARLVTEPLFDPLGERMRG